jgi:hypothetical protein
MNILLKILAAQHFNSKDLIGFQELNQLFSLFSQRNCPFIKYKPIFFAYFL